MFHYDGQGHLIAETKSTGQLIRAYVYADDAPVAQIEPVTVLPADILIDNTQASFTGTWATATSIAGYYGTNYRTNTKGTGADKAVWTPNVPSPGTYQVYARWVAASTHASNAPFTVKYNGGSATVKKSQRSSGGQWVLLGSYTFAAGTAGSVTLTDKADGTVIADAIKLVATSGGGTQEALRSLHTDHLNTPRLATNAQGTIIWRWEGKAFGDTAPNQNPDGDAQATIINLRMPGQYADAESNLSYNWNRHYSPVLGRYITSDPIGLAGGLNTYAYVGNNPLKFTDPDGRMAIPMVPPVPPFVQNGTIIDPSTGEPWVDGPEIDPWKDITPIISTPPNFPTNDPRDCEKQLTQDLDECNNSCGAGLSSVVGKALCKTKAYIRYKACKRINNPGGNNPYGDGN